MALNPGPFRPVELTANAGVPALVDARVEALRTEYSASLAFLNCQLRDEQAFMELTCSFALLQDMALREHVIKLGSLATTADIAVKARYLDAVFVLVRRIIDDAVAGIAGQDPR